jgi:hypothetical protein
MIAYEDLRARRVIERVNTLLDERIESVAIARAPPVSVLTPVLGGLLRLRHAEKVGKRGRAKRRRARQSSADPREYASSRRDWICHGHEFRGSQRQSI